MDLPCPDCGTLLELPAGSAGAETDCPACGAEFVVRSRAAREVPADAWTPRRSVFDAAPAAPESPLACPICGCANGAEAEDCRACGTSFRRLPRRQRHRAPRGIFVGDILATTAAIFVRNVRTLLAAMVVEAFGVTLVAAAVLFPTLFVIGLVARGGGGANPALAALLLTMLVVPLFAIWQAVHVGHYRLMLKLCRGQPVDAAELLSVSALVGGRLRDGRMTAPGLATKMVLLGTLYWVLCLVGAAMLLIPGLVFALVAWPFGRVLVDRNPPGTGAITESIELVAPHWPGVLSVVSILWGAQFAVGAVPWLAGGFYAPLIVLLVLTPFSSLALTVTYLRLRDEPTAVEAWVARERASDAMAWGGGP